MQPRYSLFETAAKNCIWLPSLALAWTAFTEKTGFEVDLPENARATRETISTFNANPCSDKDVDQSIYFGAGIQSEAVGMIENQIKTKYGKEYPLPKIDPISNGHAILYGVIYKKIQLQYPFFSIPGKIMHFCNIKVPCFEPTEREQRQQIDVVRYINKDEFLLRLRLLEPDSFMFIHRRKQPIMIDQVIEQVKAAKEKLEPITEGDVFKIPQISVHVSRCLSEVIGRKGTVRSEQKKVEITDCFQEINLQMLGQPYRDKMEGLVLSIPEENVPKLKPKIMMLRGPFWLVLQKKDRHPYFAMHVQKHDEKYQ